ncbi:MAG: peptidoglycan-binding protein [Clostridiales bacterium]|nr:peptidoglycan-binding protein [Candidatus Cacconaster stercorequi]
MPYPVIPDTIVVHLGPPNQEAENVTVPFADYIKNVASNEIYPTWPESAIRANMLAQISFALNRVYTEYYRSRGYDFDITNATQYDQAYVPNGDVFENISRIADQIFNNYIVRQGNIQPLFAQFCDGVNTQCQGLSQWGSVDLARQGLVPYEILQRYYGDNIDLVYNAPVAPNIPSYPGIPLRRGSAGADVRALQRGLNRIAKNYPAIPVISDVSGFYDIPTETAVQAFQHIFNLAADGIVGKATWYKVKDIYNSVKGLSELIGEGLTITEAQRVYPRVLRFGDTGNSVRVIQYYLAFLGFFYPELPPIAVTGVFDEATRDAVFTFQEQYGLSVDGIVGRDTWNRLQQVYEDTLQNLPEEYQTYAEEIFPGRFLVPGDTGAAVTQIQANLRRIAQSDPSIPAVEVTGTYDTATQNAVRVIQQQAGFEPNGVVGPLTWQAIITRGRGF